VGLITECIDVMRVGHDKDIRASGEPYETHPLAVAHLYRLVYPHDHLGFGVCLLHDVVEQSCLTIANLARFLNREVALMVDPLTKRDRSEFRCQDNRGKEYYSRLFPAARRDKRIAMVKMCDRIHNVETIGALNYERAVRVMNETEEVLLPFFRSLNLPLTKELARLCVQQRARLARSRLERILI